ncbi:hypothetical protein [Mucilaginibacter sp. L196]|uniref:hypothetical protein n=1 Tax=Mucilaginibacter sp. L196 TaxID=1641870 RepID=UPI00131ABD68|nr:hypothetical protein [Mucilaginibacter sp. L196]
MIPEQFKQNVDLEIKVYGQDVQVAYRYYWLDKHPDPEHEPLVSHMEFRSESPIISETGYRSHFFHTEVLEDTAYRDIAELVTEFGEHFARENGYEPPAIGHQYKLF